ncbi:SMC-Scp complex subunit ScpB [Patescibacteria group bacterium]|nr:SMC-Scp complex subunit ScpB [Patescibacteria group bacterium]MBU1350115.1 SMC-Scp complex subunit ScpB [Patescibacteria group bacterium]MBU1421164.1 SMC-Scp complex subunit ScpB [Patescibacteria group bacterium]MBU1684062.1 SMC-Scp complex subunit ScpB [Patescibacteria group bacterium]MBU1778299.1 SMC-Scp complex subunit ScpB [Patescibacteria group bacterium]
MSKQITIEQSSNRTIENQLESLLFISHKPMSARQLADLANKPMKEVQKTVEELIKNYKNNKRGIQIIENNNKYQMVSASENAELVKKLVKNEITGELSKPSLETLTIIAYRGPVSKLDLDRIRGVNCALILRNLLLRGLIESKFDRKKNEIYYNVTFDFIRFLGVNNVNELPDYERLHKDDALERMLTE